VFGVVDAVCELVLSVIAIVDVIGHASDEDADLIPVPILDGIFDEADTMFDISDTLWDVSNFEGEDGECGDG